MLTQVEIPDETLRLYAFGELPAIQACSIAAKICGDEAVRVRVQQMLEEVTDEEQKATLTEMHEDLRRVGEKRRAFASRLATRSGTESDSRSTD